ncbi:spore coat protein CotJB [Ferroacidibacillus organovorans]|uniref:Spore coat protein CotJB n=1 Tax=Ferroacidibacillus organovorans TaxID=1765683 RepID=A0A162RVD7_9BACL|nr:spore coat protein CotJB [Ferroacidibacillus organovorans]KYP79290.1 hypothetical protein AYJ22_04510 [Ferroacidibacillus organovorans]OAG95264.1 hypothetical protein AYW79_00920 [Ferroacidibacillus organovorans]OPG17191.1 spore coat protein CotJB [Ferroacidibacillus organovorans]
MAQFISESYYQDLHELQAIDFVLVELTLYLDTHPADANALAQFELFQRGKKNLVAQFEHRHGPLYHYGEGKGGAGFAWAKGPWPWQV